MKTKKLFSVVILMTLCFGLIQCTPSPQSKTEKKPEVKNVIFMIGDGMGVSQVYAGLTANKGRLALERAPYTGFSKTYSANNYVTDSAAGGTALACGVKTNNGVIGQDEEGNDAKSMLAYAEEQGMATGVVVSISVTHATPASFLAHQPSRNMEEEIAEDILQSGVDVLIGGGRKFFEARKDQKNLTEELRAKDYAIAYTMDEVKAAQSGKLVGLLSEGYMPAATERGDMLPESVGKALDILSQNEKGFFLMVEGSQIDSYCHANNGDATIAEMIDFDKAVEVAFNFADKNPGTLVVITADHETGGLYLPGGNFSTGEVNMQYGTGGHTGVMVPVFSYGPGAENFTGIQENVDFLGKVLDLLNIEH